MPAWRSSSSFKSECDIEAGCSISVSTLPRLTASTANCVDSTRRTPAPRPPDNSKLSIPAETGHLLGGKFVLGMACHARIENTGHRGVRFYFAGDGQSVLVVSFHSHSERLYSAKTSHAAKGSSVPPNSVRFIQIDSPISSLHTAASCQDVGMAGEILCGTVQYDISPKFKRAWL